MDEQGRQTSAKAPDSVFAGPAADLREAIRSRREDVLSGWAARIAGDTALRAREDLSEGAPSAALLEPLLDIILGQLEAPAEYTRMRDRIFAGDIGAFTPDAACRLLLALKYTMLEGPFLAPDAREPVSGLFDELLLRLSQFTHERRHREVRESEQARARALNYHQERLGVLLETMNEGFTGVDTLERITIFNRRMEQLTGFSRGEMVGRHIYNLYPPECLEQVRTELRRRRQGQSSSYQTEVLCKDGRRVPVRISGAPLRDHTGRDIGSFAVVTDIGEQVQAERRLRQTSDEKARLLDRERKRAAHFAIVNRVAQLVLSTLDPDEIFERVVRSVEEHFKYHHAVLFLTDPDTGDLVVQAQAGKYADVFPEGYAQKAGEGIVGAVVASGESMLSNDVSTDPRRVLAFPEETQTGAELCVPIKLGTRVLGALDVQTLEKDVFDESDLTSLRILADLVALVIHNARLYQETVQVKEFNEQVIRGMPLPIILLDTALIVLAANDSYLHHQSLTREDLIGRPLPQAVPDSYIVTPEGREAIGRVINAGQQVSLEQRVVPRGAYQNRIVDILISPIETDDGERRALVVIDDLTESLDKAYESSLLRRVVQIMQGILDLDRLLHAILTCVTAGTALRFNRAVLLLVDDETDTLVGRMGVGPATREEAARIWAELGTRNPSVDDILAEYDRRGATEESPLTVAAKQIRVPLDEPDDILARCVREKKTFRVTQEDALAISPTLWAALGTHHFVAVPLVSRDTTIGVLLADNLYSGAPITDDSVDLLAAFAGHAALALENANLYHRLEDKIHELEHAQEELVQSERLAVIGQMSARIAHEIRNPLATIGGFARAIVRRPEPDRVATAAGIIADEVSRLETLLKDTLSFTRPAAPRLEESDINALLGDVRTMVEDEMASLGVTYVDETDPGLPPVAIDSAQFKQVFLNIVQNALQAMPGGGRLTVSTASRETDGEAVVTVRVQDEGEGIDPEAQEQLFSPFFTTKTYGTGLGLAICKKIVDDHGGTIGVESTPGQGTTIQIDVPVHRPPTEPAA